MINSAYEQLKEGNLEAAVEAFSDCLLLEPSEARVYYGRGMARFQLKQWPAAISDFRKAVELDPEEPEHWVSLGLSLASGDGVYEAIDVFERLLEKKPKYARARILLAQLYYRLGVITKGHHELDLALSSRPTLSERKTIEGMKKEQLLLDKKRYYRPDFEALRQQNRASSSGFLRMIRSLFIKTPKDPHHLVKPQ